MKKVMITKGLRGKENPEQYHDICIEAVKRYYAESGEQVEFTSSTGVSNSFNGNRLYYLGNTIKEELSVADEVVFMDDWEKYDGCLTEHFIAVRYGVKCIYLSSN